MPKPTHIAEGRYGSQWGGRARWILINMASLGWQTSLWQVRKLFAVLLKLGCEFSQDLGSKALMLRQMHLFSTSPTNGELFRVLNVENQMYFFLKKIHLKNCKIQKGILEAYLVHLNIFVLFCLLDKVKIVKYIVWFKKNVPVISQWGIFLNARFHRSRYPW